MSRTKAARQIRETRAMFYGLPPHMRPLFRRWMVAECGEISAAAPRFWRT